MRASSPKSYLTQLKTARPNSAPRPPQHDMPVGTARTCALLLPTHSKLAMYMTCGYRTQGRQTMVCDDARHLITPCQDIMHTHTTSQENAYAQAEPLARTLHRTWAPGYVDTESASSKCINHVCADTQRQGYGASQMTAPVIPGEALGFEQSRKRVCAT